MKRVLSTILLMSLCTAPLLVGCDKTVKDDETVKKNADGTVTKDETKVTQQPNGDVTKTTETQKN